MTRSESTFACDLTRLSPADRQRLIDTSRDLFAQATEARILADGYAIGFVHASPQLVAKAGEFIAFDRLCCDFLRHELASEPHGGMLWLRLTGAPGAQAFIRADLLALLPPHIADQLPGLPGQQCRDPGES